MTVNYDYTMMPHAGDTLNHQGRLWRVVDVYGDNEEGWFFDLTAADGSGLTLEEVPAEEIDDYRLDRARIESRKRNGPMNRTVVEDIKKFRSAYNESLGRREGPLDPHSRMAVVEQSGVYAWVIVDPPEYVGLMGPRGATMTADQIKSQGEKFKMYDDDGEFMAAGYIAGDYDGFEPMDDWGQPGLGATEIKYKGPSGAWETL